MSSNYRLKALIKAIRSTKTQADERSVIQRESAAIRTSFKEDDTLSRHANIAKLLYIHMLGYPAHFGQIECLKLAASPRFGDKRLGYLGVMLLLDENQEVLTLVTNSLKNDMNHANMYIVGLALCTLGNISSEAMARDLALEIEKLLGSSNSYIRRKAALCAMRICRKIPDLVDQFAGKAKSMLSDRNHGTLLCGITLATELCLLDESCIDAYRKTVPLLVRHLKSLSTAGYSPEHDVSGITDPFLQCKILHLLRILGTNDPESSEAMNDILAQVASNTEGTKNVGNAILYEAVLTILEIEADTGLRVLAVNILGRFLSNKDNNIRYVALNTLNKVVLLDTNAVQRHRNVILDCLRDGDISIRRRALELSYALINDSNIRVLIRELLAFLEIADAEFKTTMTTQICLAADRFAPNKRWHIDTVLRAMKLAGNYVKEDIISSFITLICHTPELQSYTAHKLYESLSQDLSQEALTIVGLWIIGEYGDVLLQPFSKSSLDDDHAEDMPAIAQNELVDLFERALALPDTNLVVHEYAMVALVKLSVRISDPGQISRIHGLLNSRDRSHEVEVQQRAVEFGQMFAHADVRIGLLERMPLPEVKKTLALPTTRPRKAIPISSPSKSATPKDSIYDLLNEGAEPAAQRGAVTANGAPVAATTDLLADLFGDVPKQPVQATAAAAAAAAAPPPSQPMAEAARPDSREKVAYDANGLRIALTWTPDTKNPQVTNILATFTSTMATVDKVSFQAAVPKLQMLAMSGTTVTPTTPQRQQMRVMSSAPTSTSTSTPPSLRLRLRISYSIEDRVFTDQVDWSHM